MISLPTRTRSVLGLTIGLCLLGLLYSCNPPRTETTPEAKATPSAVNPPGRNTFSTEQVEAAKKAAESGAKETRDEKEREELGCTGRISQVIDVGFEGMKFTSAVFGSNPGGGEGGQFDKTPVLSTELKLDDGACLNAHLSAIVGSGQAYGTSNLTLFQVTLTPTSVPAGGPRHMVGHFEPPFGGSSPAVALEAERDVDMYASNFFQKVGKGPHEVPPGSYRVDVWWAGGPNPGGALGAAFILKLYLQ